MTNLMEIIRKEKEKEASPESDLAYKKNRIEGCIKILPGKLQTEISPSSGSGSSTSSLIMRSGLVTCCSEVDK